MLDEHTIRDGHLTPEALDTLARGACDERTPPCSYAT